MTWAAKEFRATWADEIRLRVNGRDVTYFRDVPTDIGGYQLQEPYAFGPADFTFPQITQFEVGRFGTGKLRWLHHGAPCELVPVLDGEYGDRLWAGFITSIQAGPDGVGVHCDGRLSGRLSVQDKQPPVFAWKKDLGVQVYDTVLQADISLHPYLGARTGIDTYAVGGGSDQLSHLNDLLSQAVTDDGRQWTVARAATGRRFVMTLKDTSTVHATVFLGAAGVELDVTRDMTEEPNRIWGTGTDPTGQKITNAVIPNLFSGEAAEYPYNDGRSFGIGTEDADTDTGAGISALQRKLVGMAFMTRREAAEHVYEQDTADAVRALQRRAGLARTGRVNPATWRALFNVRTTGRTLYGAHVLPMAQAPEVQRFLLTSNGSIDVANPDYDRRVIPVDRTIDHGGGVWKEQMLRWSDKLLDRLQSGANWVGTLNLAGDLFAGNVGPNTSAPVPLSRLALREGQNVKVVGFDGDTVFHVSGINVGGDRSVSLAVDTHGRDLLTVGAIIARNKESRRSAAREFITSVRRPNAMDTMVVSNELFGRVEDWPLQGGKWNRLMIPCGQSGTIDRVRLHFDAPAEFVAGVSVWRLGPGRLNAVAGSNPLDKDSKWSKGHTQHRLKESYLFLYSAGQATQPLGYYPRAKTGDDNKATGAPITGKWEDDAGFAFRTFHDDRVSGVLYLYVFPDRDTVLQGGKVFYVNITEGA